MMESVLKNGGKQWGHGGSSWLDELLTPAQESAELHVTESWLDRARWAGTGPDFIKVGRKIFYTRRMNREWLCGRRHTSTRAKASRNAGPGDEE